MEPKGESPFKGGSVNNGARGIVFGTVVQTGPVHGDVKVAAAARPRRWIAPILLVPFLVALVVVSDQPKASSAPVVNQPIDEPRSIDPCTFAKPARDLMRKFGEVKLDSYYGNFNRCDLIVRSPDGSTEVDVEFQLRTSDPPADAPQVTKSGRVTIAWEELDGDECDRILSLSEPFIVVVGAELNSGQHADLCGMADEATRVATSVLNGLQPLDRRDFVEDSLENEDACALLDTEALIQFGVDGSAPEPGFGNWECGWGNAGERSVAVRFDQSAPLSAPGDGTLVKLGAHTAYIEADGDGGGNNCRVQIEHRSFTANGYEKSELVQVVFRGPRPPVPPESLCAPAKSVAAAVETKLPH